MKIHKFVFAGFVMSMLAGMLQAGNSRFWGKLQAGPFRPGFRLVETSDASRTFPADVSGGAHARPIRMYLWYPALKDPGQTMKLDDYVRMAAQDFKPVGSLDQPGPETPSLPVQLSKGAEPDRLPTLLGAQTAAVRDAAAAPGKFPLLVLGQGLFYESPLSHFVLCEFLAAHGYVVASSPLLGTQYRLVNLNVEDLETQVRDMEFVLGEAGRLPAADPGKLGVIGYDLGGMAGLLLAMRNAGVDCFLSLDSGILDTHDSGLPKTHPQYGLDRFRIPWMHITQDRFIRSAAEREKTPSLYENKVSGASHLVHVPTANHGGFSSYAAMELTRAVAGYWGTPEPGASALYEDICRVCLAFLDRYLKQEGGGLEDFLKAGPSEAAGRPGNRLRFEWKDGRALPPPEARLVHLIIERGIAAARPEFERLRAAEPQKKLVGESVLNWLGYHFLYWWGREAEAAGVFELNIFLFPDSWSAFDSLAEACLVLGRTEDAVRNYKRSLELNPENANAKAALERLGR